MPAASRARIARARHWHPSDETAIGSGFGPALVSPRPTQTKGSGRRRSASLGGGAAIGQRRKVQLLRLDPSQKLGREGDGQLNLQPRKPRRTVAQYHWHSGQADVVGDAQTDMTADDLTVKVVADLVHKRQKTSPQAGKIGTILGRDPAGTLAQEEGPSDLILKPLQLLAGL